MVYEIALALFGNPFVKAAAGLTAANVIVGISYSLYSKTFYLGSIADFLLTRVAAYFLGAASVQLVLYAVPSDWSGLTSAVSNATWLFVCGALIGKIVGTLQEMGFPIVTKLPKAFGDAPTPAVVRVPDPSGDGHVNAIASVPVVAPPVVLPGGPAA